MNKIQNLVKLAFDRKRDLERRDRYLKNTQIRVTGGVAGLMIPVGPFGPALGEGLDIIWQ